MSQGTKKNKLTQQQADLFKAIMKTGCQIVEVLQLGKKIEIEEQENGLTQLCEEWNELITELALTSY